MYAFPNGIARWSAVLCAALVPAVALGMQLRAGSPATKLQFSDLEGKRYGAREIEAAKASVFVFTSTECPIANRYVPRLLALAKEYGPRGARFYMVDSNAEDSAEELKRYTAERSLPFPVVKDEGTRIADVLDAHVTPQAVVVDPKGDVRYSGRIDDNADVEKVSRRDLALALDALLDGKPVAQPKTLAFGCGIFRDTAARPAAPSQGDVTYAEQVAPILNGNCVICHRKGEVAPFALETYSEARTWSRAIKAYTTRRLMPPWKPVAGHGEFVDARALSPEQITTLARWADSGAPEGDASRTPAPPTFSSSDSLKIPNPDVVLQPDRPYHLEAEGRDVYRNFVLPITFDQDRFLTAVEPVPDNRSIVHHMVLYIDPTGRSAEMDGKEKEPGYTVPGIGIGILGATWGEVWVPGSDLRPLPQGLGVRVPKGSRLVLQVHYHKSGKPEVDRSRVALHFSKSSQVKEVLVFPVGSQSLDIPAGVSDHTVKAGITLPWNVTLYSIFPHMHMIGKSMRVTATLPDNTAKPLVFIDDWDFNWQATYRYREPMHLPRGTRLELTAVYDNSPSNPRQTSLPPKEVHFGEQTTDEMCFAFVMVTIDR